MSTNNASFAMPITHERCLDLERKYKRNGMSRTISVITFGARFSEKNHNNTLDQLKLVCFSVVYMSTNT